MPAFSSAVTDAGAPVVPWPAWLEASRVDDSATAAAYEATPPRCRAALKAALAVAHFHFGESASFREDTLRNERVGFFRGRCRYPAPWVLLVFPPDYAAAARLTAACAAALLAGVARVGAVCPGGTPRDQALVSLELSGVEDIFQSDRAALGVLLDELAAMPGPRGRVVLLHAGELAEIAQRARDRNIPCYEEGRPPHLRVEQGAGIDRDLLAFAHGGTAALDAALAQAGPVDAVYRAVTEPPSPAADARLTLGAGCEGFWLHPGLDPGFFTVSRQAFAPLADLPSHPDVF